jgi:hypothetical protein
MCFGSAEEVGEASNIAFRQLQGAEAYVPLIRSPLYADPFLGADVKEVPRQFLPVRTLVDGTMRETSYLCLNREKDLPFIKDEAVRRSIFRSERGDP